MRRRSLVILALISLLWSLPTTAGAQGVGLWMTAPSSARDECSDLTTPVDGRTFCFDHARRGLRVYDGTRYRELPINAWFNVLDFGATGDGSTDDATAITAAINALPTNGSVLYFPPGTYNTSAQITLTGKRSVTLLGLGRGVSAGAAMPSQLRYTGTTSPFIIARSTFGTAIVGMMVTYNNASFAGTMIDLSQDSVLLTDSALFVIDTSLIGGSGVSGAARLVDLDKTITSSLLRSNFINAAVAVRGAATSTSYSNKITIAHNQFASLTTAALQNVRESWLVHGNAFEQLQSGAAGALVQQASVTATSLMFTGNWLGDATAGGTWIDLAAASNSPTIIANTIGVISGGGTGIALTTSTGAVIQGNTFSNLTTGVNLVTGNDSAIISGNTFLTVTTAVSGNTQAFDITLTGNNPKTSPITYTPSWTSSGTAPAIGNGTLTGRYSREGNKITIQITMTMGSTTTFGTGQYQWSIPIAAAATFNPIGAWQALDSGTAYYVGSAKIAAGASVIDLYSDAAATSVGQTVPFTWANTDTLDIQISYFTN